MPRGVRKVAKKRAPRKPRGAKLEIDAPQEMVSSQDEYHRREAVSIALTVHGGKPSSLKDLLRDAWDIYMFFKGWNHITSSVDPATANEALKHEVPIAQESNHKSKFEEISM